jgi:hypothetical protein
VGRKLTIGIRWLGTSAGLPALFLGLADITPSCFLDRLRRFFLLLHLFLRTEKESLEADTHILCKFNFLIFLQSQSTQFPHSKTPTYKLAPLETS